MFKEKINPTWIFLIYALDRQNDLLVALLFCRTMFFVDVPRMYMIFFFAPAIRIVYICVLN